MKIRSVVLELLHADIRNDRSLLGTVKHNK